MVLHADTQERWRALLASTLEAIVHHLIFARRVYPRSSFVDSMFLGVRVKVNRHPQVVKYISQTVGVVAESWVGSTQVQQVIICLMKAALIPLETWALKMEGVSGLAGSLESQEFEALEKAMRDLVLSVHGLNGLDPPRLGDSATFQIAVSVRSDSASKLSPELAQLLACGSWYETANTTVDASHGGGVIRAVHEAAAVMDRLSISFVALSGGSV